MEESKSDNIEGNAGLEFRQIIPAPGWFARFESGEARPVVCWILCEMEDGHTFVTGMIAWEDGIEMAEGKDGFVEYAMQ